MDDGMWGPRWMNSTQFKRLIPGVPHSGPSTLKFKLGEHARTATDSNNHDFGP